MYGFQIRLRLPSAVVLVIGVGWELDVLLLIWCCWPADCFVLVGLHNARQNSTKHHLTGSTETGFPGPLFPG
jgi:hypothetical protein